MRHVQCLYCGEKIPDSVEVCPSCGKPSHYQQRGISVRRQTKFIIYFVLLVIFAAVMIVWLPR